MDALRKILIMLLCGGMLTGIFVLPVFAADGNNSDGTSKKDEIDYTLDKEVKEWLDEGNSIPAEAKFCTLSASSHMWEIDDTDVSDGKVELRSDDENDTRILAGIALRDWLKTQSFYGDKLGEKDNKIVFKRPRKTDPF